MSTLSQVQDGTVAVASGGLPACWAFEDIEREIILACEEFRAERMTIAIPVSVDDDTVRRLLAMPQVTSILLADRNESQAGSFPGRIGWFHMDQRHWQLPASVASSLFFLGPRRALTFDMGLAAVRRGIFRLIIRSPVGRSRISVVGLGARSQLTSLVIRLAWRTSFRLGFGILATRIGSWAFRVLLVRKRVDLAIRPFLVGQRAPLASKDEFVRGRVMLVNSALAWGGAERQLVNTAVGLTVRGVRDVTVLCDNSGSVPDHDFFRWRLDAAGIEVRELRRNGAVLADDARVGGCADVLNSLNFFAIPLGDEIGFYVREMLEWRPEVVHAWQDHTSVKVGIAAAIVGVPKIILSARNVAPYNFRYDLPYLHAAYRALLYGKRIVFLNNSSAGAADYAKWLNVRGDRIRVVRNGFDFEALACNDEEAQRSFRERLGLPDGVFVVGSVFRLYEEKDPLLWIRSAALVAKARADVVFLIVGVGLMQAEVVKLAEDLGIRDRVFLPGAEKQPGLAYRLMDVFLLTSRFEGLPNVVIEAQSLGVPVVATNAGGTREAVLEGQTGFVLMNRDPEGLARKILFVLDNQQWADEARRIGPDFIHRRFGLERMIDETLDAYGWTGSPSPRPMSDASHAEDVDATSRL